MSKPFSRLRAYCPDCGPAGVWHFSERLAVRINGAIRMVNIPMVVVRWMRPAATKLRPGRLAPAAAKAAAAIGLGKIVKQPDEHINWRARVLWEEAERRGIVMHEFRLFGLPRDIFYATWNGDTIAFDGLPRGPFANNASLDWMDDKGIILEKFRAAGIPVPQGTSVKTVAAAEKAFRQITGAGAPAVIVKPAVGSRSRHTYTHITDLTALRTAFLKAKQLSPHVVVEEELSGFVFRITLIDGKIAGVMRREPPHVIGDGTHTVRELVTAENENPLRHGPIFHEIMIDEHTPDVLAKQGLSFDAVPAAGRMVIIHPKVSRTYGASTTEITDIHPDNRKMFMEIAKVLDNPVVGVDFMIDDMARSWKEVRCGVIECNSLPFIDLHHFPLKGPSRNAAGDIWDLAFSRNRRENRRRDDPVL